MEGVLSYCHHKVPFGVVEAINANIRAVMRRGRGYRDCEYLILNVQKSTAQALTGGRLIKKAFHAFWQRPTIPWGDNS